MPTALINDRVEITAVTIRDTPPPEPTPFETDTAAQLARYRAVLETTMGEITVEFFRKGARHVRNFLRLSKPGVYDGTAFHRVVPGFVVQTGALTSRREPLTQKQRPLVVNLTPEFNPTPTCRASCRWRAATIRRAPRPRSSSAWAMRVARQQIHRVRPRRRRHAGRRGAGQGTAQRRGAGDPRRDHAGPARAARALSQPRYWGGGALPPPLRAAIRSSAWVASGAT